MENVPETKNVYTLDMATRPTRDIVLPCGMPLTIHRLWNRDQSKALLIYQQLLATLSLTLDRDPSREEARQMLPEIINQAAQAVMETPPDMPEEVASEIRDAGALMVREFLACFSETPISIEQLRSFEIDDFEAIMEALWQLCRIPFEAAYTEARPTLAARRAAFPAQREAMALLMSDTSLPPLSAQDLTPATEESKLSTPLPSPKSKRRGSAGTPTPVHT